MIVKLPAETFVVALKFALPGQLAVTAEVPALVRVDGVMLVADPPLAHKTVIVIGLPV